jgi:hypothetical protein
MNRTRVIVNDEDLEGVAGQVISYSKRAADVGDLTARTFNFTSAFNAPFTKTNHRILQNTYNPKSSTSFPYVLQDVKLIEDGIEIYSQGQLVVRRCAGFYELYVLSGASAFYEAIKGKRLPDLDYQDLPGSGDHGLAKSWQAADVKNYRSTTEGVVAPVMNYGDFDATTPALVPGTYLPSVYYRTIIEKILYEAGFAKDGNVFATSKFTSMILAYSRPAFEYDKTFAIDRSCSALKESAQVIAAPGAGTKVTFPTVVKQDPAGHWNPATSEYTVDLDDISADAVVWGVDVQYTLDITVAGGTVDIMIMGRNGIIVDTNKGTGVYSLSSKAYYDVAVPGDTVAAVNDPSSSSDDVKVMIRTNSGAPVVTVNSGSLVIDASNNVFTGTDTVAFINKLLPDMLQTDFIKDFAIQFGLLFDARDGVLYARSVNEIITNIAGSQDWTAKRVKRIDDELAFTPLDYAQRNVFKYTVKDELIGDLGSGSIDIENETIEAEKTIYTSPFANSMTRTYGGILMAQVPIFSDSTTYYEFDNDPGLRLLLVRNKYSHEPSVEYNGSAQAAYLVAYFEDPAQDDTMSWDRALEDNYSMLTPALQQAKTVKHLYMLTRQDFRRIDFFYPIFDKDSLYIINDIPSFVPGRETEVELFKVG